jgi:hypothetical protein
MTVLIECSKIILIIFINIVVEKNLCRPHFVREFLSKSVVRNSGLKVF